MPKRRKQTKTANNNTNTKKEGAPTSTSTHNIRSLSSTSQTEETDSKLVVQLLDPRVIHYSASKCNDVGLKKDHPLPTGTGKNNKSKPTWNSNAVPKSNLLALIKEKRNMKPTSNQGTYKVHQGSRRNGGCAQNHHYPCSISKTKESLIHHSKRLRRKAMQPDHNCCYDHCSYEQLLMDNCYLHCNCEMNIMRPHICGRVCGCARRCYSYESEAIGNHESEGCSLNQSENESIPCDENKGQDDEPPSKIKRVESDVNQNKE